MEDRFVRTQSRLNRWVLPVGGGILLSILLFLNAGKWLDVTDKPLKSDVVVCLGGGTVERVKKSLELLHEGYASRMLLLGESWYNRPYLDAHRRNEIVEINEDPKNTEEEIHSVVKYMKKHSYQKALIVTDPPHTARVNELLWLYEDKGVEYRIIGSDVRWWNAPHYFENDKARQFVWHEIPRIALTLLAYFIPQKLKEELFDE